MRLARILFTILFLPVYLLAQATSQIQGTVTDGTGAAIPGADVKVTQTSTGAVRAASTGADGGYVLPSLPLGPYQVQVSKTGFSTYVQRGIELQVGSNPTVDVKLNVGEVSTQVQVEANAALVDTQGTSVGAVIEQRRIVELPLNGRNPVELIQLAGAAVPAGRNSTAGMPGGLNISVAGGLLSGVTYFLDGTLYNNPFDAVNLPFPFPDALQEFKVETNSMTAQNGLHSGAAVSAVVKSGTNEFHGNVFEFLRNGKMNARNFFAARRDTLKRNQFGGTIGGPIVQNKVFFFAGYQGTKLRSDPAGSQAFVPTTQMQAGDFSGCTTRGPANLIDPDTGQPFPGRRIPVSRLSAPALNISRRLPATADPCGRATFGAIERPNEHQILGKTDYQVSDKQMLFGRYMMTTYRKPASFGLSGNLLDSPTGLLDNTAQTIGLGHTYLFSPTTVNSFRAAYNRVAVFRSNDDYFSACDLGIKFHCYLPHQMLVGVTGEFTIGSGVAVDASFIPSYLTISNDLSMVRGSHQIGVGFSGFKYQHSHKANVFSPGNFGFNGLAAALNQGTGYNMSDFLLGRVNALTAGVPNTVFTNKLYYGIYVMDTWKASRKLTVNAGLRWEPFLPQRLNDGNVYNFSFDRFLAGTRSTRFPKAPAGMLWALDPGVTGKAAVKDRYNQFAPRLGLSFDPNGDGKTVIRAAAGISYDFPNTQIMSTPATAPPFAFSVQGLTGPLNFSDPWSTVAGGNPFPGTLGEFGENAAFMAQQPLAKATTVYNWNLGIQRQVGSSWLLSATYIGSQTAHLWVTQQLNPSLLVPNTAGTAMGTCPAGVTVGCNSTTNTIQRRKAYLANRNEGRFYSFVDEVESGGTINYNGLLLAMAKRLTKGFNLNLNYTWSHCIGDITQASTVLGTGAGLNKPDDRRYDRGNCQTPTLDGTQALDRRHIFNATAVYEMPKFANRMVNAAASNWRISASYRKLSGAWQTVTTGVDRALNGQPNTQRPNLVLEDTAATNQGASCPTAPCISWLNPAAFAQPAFGTFGNLGRSNVPGPGFVQIDMALSRLFRVREGKTLELRGESFNLTNSLRLGNPTTALNNANFGRIQSGQDPRIMQVAVKFVF